MIKKFSFRNIMSLKTTDEGENDTLTPGLPNNKRLFAKNPMINESCNSVSSYASANREIPSRGFSKNKDKKTNDDSESNQKDSLFEPSVQSVQKTMFERTMDSRSRRNTRKKMIVNFHNITSQIHMKSIQRSHVRAQSPLSLIEKARNKGSFMGAGDRTFTNQPCNPRKYIKSISPSDMARNKRNTKLPNFRKTQSIFSSLMNARK